MNNFFQKENKAQMSDENSSDNDQYLEVNYISLIKCLENIVEINQRN
jgi:hypothetical protein